MKPQVIRSYWHPTYPEEILVVELDVEGKKVRKQILVNDVLNQLVTVPIMPMPDSKLFKKAEELALLKI